MSGARPTAASQTSDTSTPISPQSSPGYASDAETRGHQYAPERIHIIGLGAIGKLVAHSLRGLRNPPPVTLISHRWGLLKEWERSKKDVTIREGERETSQKGFDMELALPPKRFFGIQTNDTDFIFNNPDGLLPHEAAAELKKQQGRGRGIQEDQVEPRRAPEESDEPIHNLIVTVKIHLTVSAMLSLKHRILPTTTICLLQNGMGVIDELNEHVFPDPETRPNYMLGIVSHGANSPPGSQAFYAVHAGRGTIALSTLPRTRHAEADVSTPVEYSPTSRYLLRTLTRCPILGAIGVPRVEFLQQKLEKLAQNAVVNTMTVMLDARNGAVNFSFALTKVQRLLLAEISLVLRSLPELQGLPNVATRFSADRLETLVVSIANKTRENISSTLADVRAGKPTEIRYINGYIIKRGEEMGISCVCNYMAMQLVIGKAKMVQNEKMDEVVLEAPADYRPSRG
ncbi:ketopantoate reductase PanE/ApbA C terminal-domain-containing protein [Elsinoe ampelina]|uniref:Ketopantoate reductase PanE/ApbA C terminal-domain-containing protein n=1 Tax=Elsinoe ampelina TaxID=302913 RepID=A0A6A6G3H5_9PEZI|nr:ketopantoate reductase PanE/ApbA C terminal-domain-containing protein [Elsinoe ampelina]